ncbi:hypothetical protein TREES_T100021731 [Tupaia chinensis]|uniref:Uncharacterized protein n=1 Tax=Tupaia chinensis TaxID=246437 RepID=L9JP31_TUPCH|nr:hypothetical protein TREES_T100021731 [Tupaia chinensis]
MMVMTNMTVRALRGYGRWDSQAGEFQMKIGIGVWGLYQRELLGPGGPEGSRMVHRTTPGAGMGEPFGTILLHGPLTCCRLPRSEFSTSQASPTQAECRADSQQCSEAKSERPFTATPQGSSSAEVPKLESPGPQPSGVFSCQCFHAEDEVHLEERAQETERMTTKLSMPVRSEQSDCPYPNSRAFELQG